MHRLSAVERVTHDCSRNQFVTAIPRIPSTLGPLTSFDIFFESFCQMLIVNCEKFPCLCEVLKQMHQWKH
jgi:hypothetical protein